MPRIFAEYLILLPKSVHSRFAPGRSEMRFRKSEIRSRTTDSQFQAPETLNESHLDTSGSFDDLTSGLAPMLSGHSPL
ncbi:Neuron Navigator 3 [Manis pentadactyla]|nr:Neuron Navigator 3 [Manis pentadactyla]